MMNRRTLFGTAAGAAAMTAFARERGVLAATGAVNDVELRGSIGRMERPGTLALESQQDFTLGFRVFQAQKMRRTSARLLNEALIEQGIDPKESMTYSEMLQVVDGNPMINMAHRAWLSNQQVTWKTLQDYFHANADLYLSEMEANDETGPGKLELRPSMFVPEYTRHEIHIQPEGYVGDPFAGHIYHYGTNSFYISVLGHNEQDQIHKNVAGRLPLPADGKVKRILDMGCGIGQMSCALKERFPDAEVWGIDIGGPMVRYAHMRANDMNNGTNFRQALAEETGFPDGYFDLVTSYIMHHEVPAEKTLEIIAEANRVLRPGGVYVPLDFVSSGTTGPAARLHGRWWDHRWNNEVWSLSYHSIDFTKEIAKRGFKQIEGAKPIAPQFGDRNFAKV
jgi:ubiquinone/menaquinone biosynthesis C-methylase UbiE